jgi:hypothetical protein
MNPQRLWLLAAGSWLLAAGCWQLAVSLLAESLPQNPARIGPIGMKRYPAGMWKKKRPRERVPEPVKRGEPDC